MGVKCRICKHGLSWTNSIQFRSRRILMSLLCLKTVGSSGSSLRSMRFDSHRRTLALHIELTSLHDLEALTRNT